jgi:hypothetical protein
MLTRFGPFQPNPYVEVIEISTQLYARSNLYGTSLDDEFDVIYQAEKSIEKEEWDAFYLPKFEKSLECLKTLNPGARLRFIDTDYCGEEADVSFE